MNNPDKLQRGPGQLTDQPSAKAEPETGDDLRGTKADDALVSGAGHDTLVGLEGADDLEAGSGHDVLDGGAGNDRLIGGSGDDFIDAGSGHDQLWGGEGRDFLFGGSGDDQLTGGPGNDTLNGAAGNDLLEGGEGEDLLCGGSGNDMLHGGSGADILLGGPGNDIMTGGDGRDTFRWLIDGDRPATVDRITDFSSADDWLQFSGAALTHLAKEQESSGLSLQLQGRNSVLLLSNSRQQLLQTVILEEVNLLADGAGTLSGPEALQRLLDQGVLQV